MDAASPTSVQFSPEQSKLVKESWKLLRKDDPGKYAMAFFLKIFEIAPASKALFSFLNNSSVSIEKNPKLKEHSLQVFMLLSKLVTQSKSVSQTGQSATQLGEKGALDALSPKLSELGRKHVGYGVVDEHFDVVKAALLMTLAEAVPDNWNANVREAWSMAYDELASTMKKEMKVVREQHT